MHYKLPAPADLWCLQMNNEGVPQKQARLQLCDPALACPDRDGAANPLYSGKKIKNYLSHFPYSSPTCRVQAVGVDAWETKICYPGGCIQPCHNVCLLGPPKYPKGAPVHKANRFLAVFSWGSPASCLHPTCSVQKAPAAAATQDCLHAAWLQALPTRSARSHSAWDCSTKAGRHKSKFESPNEKHPFLIPEVRVSFKEMERKRTHSNSLGSFCF